jgi:hypothetical protein
LKDLSSLPPLSRTRPTFSAAASDVEENNPLDTVNIKTKMRALNTVKLLILLKK